MSSTKSSSIILCSLPCFTMKISHGKNCPSLIKLVIELYWLASERKRSLFRYSYLSSSFSRILYVWTSFDKSCKMYLSFFRLSFSLSLRISYIFFR